MCLHGVTATGLHFERLAGAALAEWCVLAPDLLGHGRSDHRPPWSLEEQLTAVLASVGKEPAVWLGHSYGGRLALEAAAAAPGAVNALVLLDPVVWFPPAVLRDVAEDARRERKYASLAEAVERRFAESRLAAAPRALVAAELERHLVPGADGLLRYRYSQAAVVASHGELATAPPGYPAVPTLLVRGADSYVPYEHLLDAHRAALGALLTEATVPGGHTVLWDALPETAAAVRDWLGAGWARQGTVPVTLSTVSTEVREGDCPRS